MNANAFIKRAEQILLARRHISVKDASAEALNDALGEAALISIGADWAKSETARARKRQAFYLSAEYLTGRMVYNNLYCLGVLDEARQILMQKGVDIAILEDIEDNALGNGGLGRLAACFLDSAATHSLPLTGYGLRYKFGLFKQAFENGAQVELPDDWTKFGDPWSVRRDDMSVNVSMKGLTVRAVPYDMPVIGYGTKRVGTLRLWQAESERELELDLFNDYKYAQASAGKNACEDITKVLYPNDWDADGKKLRVRQQYLLSSASMQDILRAYEQKRGTDYRYLKRDAAIQLNDTHPVLAIPELIRLLTARGVNFSRAARIASGVFAYTNHTVMPEALECWQLELLSEVIPDIVEILKKLDKRCARQTGMHFIKGGQVHMATLAVYMCFAVNGVAALHSELVKRGLFNDWYQKYPERFQNKTNGITQRRWLGLCNPGLAQLISKRIGDGFLTHLDELKRLEAHIDDGIIDEFIAVKAANKHKLAEYIRAKEGVELPERFLFDVQIKRLHEYKRQLMNALSLYTLYMDLKSGALNDFPPTAFIFGAKAAPGYARAKAIIYYINKLAERVNADNEVNDKIRIVFVANYNCSYAERLIPAADFSEQISPAGTEASGTGNMKLMLNGAVTIGTFDGANIEITQAAGRENEVIFGADIDEIERIKPDYNSLDIYEANPIVRRAVDSLTDAGFGDPDGALEELKRSLLYGASWHKPDHYFVLHDLPAYHAARIGAYKQAAADKRAFARKCLMNVVNAGMFSSDRTIWEYARDIWNIKPL